MPSTYVAIESAQPSGASSVNFSSFGTSYTDLIIVYRLNHSAGNEDMWFRFNNDSGNNYGVHAMWASTSTTGIYKSVSSNKGLLDYTGIPGTSYKSTGYLQVFSYNNTYADKTVLSHAGRGDLGVDYTVSTWRNTAAVTSIQILPGAGTITGRVDLYGIKAA